MAWNNNLNNCRIVIRDVQTEAVLSDTVVLSYDEAKEQIEVEAENGVLQEQMTVSALIFSATGLYESHGVVVSQNDGRVLITLYEGMAQNDRHAVRYQVNITGHVDWLNRPSEGKITESFEIVIANMSTLGILVYAPKGRIKEKDVIHFSSVSKGQRILITAEATRVESLEADKEKIGCSVQLVNLG